MKVLSVGKLVQRFLAFCQTCRRPRTAQFYELELGKLTKAAGRVRADKLTLAHLAGIRRNWHFVLAVQRLLRWSIEEEGLLTVNPLPGLRRPRLGRRRRCLERWERVKLLRAAAKDFRAFLLAALESAARPEEVRTLRYEWLRWHGTQAAAEAELRAGGAVFEPPTWKGQDKIKNPSYVRLIPVSPRLGRLLARRWRAGKRVGLIFTNKDGEAWTPDMLRLRMRRLRRKCNLGEGPRGEKVCCYTMRHTALTNLAAAGVNAHLLQGIAGHENIETTSRYVHLSRRQLLDGWARIHRRSPK